MASDPKNTGIPYLIDQNLFNTLDFLVAAGNLDNLAKSFPNEICVAYLYNYAKTENDPIMAQAKFFEQINKNLLKLKNNPSCSKNKYVKQYNFIKTNLKLSPDEELVVNGANSNVTRINTTTNKLEILVRNTFDSNKTRWVEILENVNSEVNSILGSVQDNYGEGELSEEFCLYWIDVFNRSMQQVKDEYRKLDTAYEKGIFQELSDCIRQYTRFKEYYDVVNGPLSDPYYKNTNLLPPHYPSFIGDKLDDEFKKEMINFSEKACFLHRKNLQNIYTPLKNKFPATEAHGVNLITDDKYYEYIGKINDSLLGTVANYLDLGSRIFEYKVLVGLSTDGNRQEITKAIIEKVVQDSAVEVDFWQQIFNDIQTTRTTKKVLDLSESPPV